MPTLNWIGKDAVVNHHLQVPFHLLKDVPDLGCGESGGGNLIVQGDNLVALKALLPYYSGQVKCIYIDPPYNTGNENWVYNDNVNSPIIHEWLGKVVGKEAEDLSRHDKWLCMMYPRLSILRKLLSDDGVFFVSVNDIESSVLELVCKEIFGHRNFLARLIWNTEGNTDNQLEVKINHEYILMFLKDIDNKEQAVGSVVDPNTREDSNLWKGLADNNINKNNPANPPDIFTIPPGFPSIEKELYYPAKAVDDEFFRVTEERGMISNEVKSKYNIENLSGLPVKLDDLIVKDNKVQRPCRVYGGFANRKKLERFATNGFQPIDDDGGPITFYINRNAAIRYRREVAATRNILSVLRNLGTTERMRTELKNMGVLFDYPKPVALIQYLLSFGASPKESIVLDCFSGSGTTANAVLGLNNQDGGNRRSIMVEMDEHVARNITAERMRRVSQGYSTLKGERVGGLGGGFRFCELGEPLFDEAGKIRETVSFSDLARHVYFTETGEPLPRERVTKSPFIGSCKGVGIYLLYNGILRDKSTNGGNILTRAVLSHLPPFDGQKVIYCAGCLLGSDRLNSERIIVRQTPYEIKVS
jgi:adenine-specific DNA-methyltransferase